MYPRASSLQSTSLSLTLLLPCVALCFGLSLHVNAQAVPETKPAPATLRAARTARFLNGRTIPATGAAAAALDAARRQHLAMLASPRSSLLTAPWTAVGPAQVVTQEFGNVTGRVTAIAIDPSDATGNTVYLGTTGGGVWKSTNAAGPAAAVAFAPLTDVLPVFNTASSPVIASLSIGSLAVSNGIVLAGTGDPNDATDSYYGSGILRSADGGITWTLVQQASNGASVHGYFFGLSVAGLAFSSVNPSLAVAGLSQAAEGVIVNAVNSTQSEMGLYWSSDAGLTWQLATIMDGATVVQSPLLTGNSGGGNAVTSVVWNPIRQSFYAAIRYHGIYASPDGITWTRLASQPGAGLTTTACPPNSKAAGSASCPIFRGALAVQPVTGDMFALTVDSANNDQGLYQDTCALKGTACSNPTATFANALKASPLEAGSGSSVIEQADYNLSLAAAPSGTDTILYAGTIDLYRCSLAAGCTLRNTTNAQNGCANPARVAPAQHAIATLATNGGPLVYLGNDGGLWRSTDGVNELAAPCSLDDANHFQNLNAGLGSLAEVVSFAQSPTDPATLLTGLGALGTAGTSTVTNSWPQLTSGEGGTVAIDQTNPLLWYLSTGGGVSVARCAKGSACATSDFITTVIGAAQTANDTSAIHAPWLLDPGLSTNLIAGTCRAWRGTATGGALWTSANLLSRPFGAPAATACGSSSPVVRSLAAGGPVSASTNAQNAGSRIIYAGLAGSLDGGLGFGGHLFVTASANIATSASVWTDAAASPVSNDTADLGVFNPGAFDISSIAADPHDATGSTVYAAVMGLQQNGTNAPHLYRSADAGAHWTNISSNLPSAPANSVLVDPNDANTVYIALDTGVYVTTQVTTCATANCWSIFGTSLPNSPVVQLEAAAAMPTGDGRTGELRAATYGRGIWQVPLLTATAPSIPAIALSPTTVTYSNQQVGTVSAPVTVTVTNAGTASLTVSGIVTTGDFSETNNCIGTAIAPNAICAVQITFLPTATGQRVGVLTIYGNVAGGQATASLSGTGTPAAAIVLTPSALTFPATSIGATSVAQSITVGNTGGTLTSLQTPVVTGDFTLAGNTCTSALGPSSSCTLSIAFAPTASGTRTGTLTMQDGAGTQVGALTGIGTNPPTDTLAPATLNFAAQQLNTASAAQQVTLTNAGDVALTQIAASIASGDFAATNSCGNSLNAHSICAITVTYSPHSVGQQSGTLLIADQFRTQTVQLSGIGLAPPGVSLSPTNGIAFGAVGVGLTTAAQTVTLTNNGGVPLALSSVTATGDYSLVTGSNTCSASLAPAAVCTVQLVFAPTATGPRTGAVTFSDNAANSPQTLPLTGTGIDFSLAANGPSSISISTGQTATYTLLLSSATGLPGSVAFTCAGVPAHATCTVNPASAALGGNTNISVTVATGLLTVAVEPLSHGQMFWLATLLPLGILVARRRRVPVLILTLTLIAAGCSTSRTVPGETVPGTTTAVTPSGTYTLVVAGSGAGLVRSVNLTLVVQ
jgi:hypothetical protein